MLDQERQAEREIQELLESIPLSKHFPLPRTEMLDRLIEAYDLAIKRGNAFVRFLSSLSAVKYLEWMIQACARYVPGQNTTAAKVETVKQPAPVHFDDSSLDKGKVATNTTTPGKRYLPTP